jgi:hypothetical protein
LRTPEAREIRRFLRSPVTEKLSDDIVQFLEGKIANFEVYRTFDEAPRSENILEGIKGEIEKISGPGSANQFSRQLIIYWLSLDARTLAPN